jgi:hypothetical protein
MNRDGPVQDYIVLVSQIHLHADRHEVRCRGVLPPVPQMQSTVKGLPTRPEVRVAKIPPERLPLVDVSFAVPKIRLLLGAQRLSKTLLPEVG